MIGTSGGVTQRALASLTFVAMGAGAALVGFTTSASAADVCEPREAYIETTDWLSSAPAGEGWTQAEQRTVVDQPARVESTEWLVAPPAGEGWTQAEQRTVVDQAARTETTDWLTAPPAGDGWSQIDQRTVPVLAVAAHWQRYSLRGAWTGEAPPPFPGPRWEPNTMSDPHNVGREGAYSRSSGGNGNVDWFYLEWVEATYTDMSERRYERQVAAVTHVEHRYERQVAALTHLEHRYSRVHEAVTCEPEVLGTDARQRVVAGVPDCETRTVPLLTQRKSGTEVAAGQWEWTDWETVSETTRPATARECPGTDVPENPENPENPGNPDDPQTPGNPSTPDVAGNDGVADVDEPEVLGVAAKAPAAGGAPAAVPTAVDAGLVAPQASSSSPSPWILAGAALAMAGLVLGFAPVRPRGVRQI